MMSLIYFITSLSPLKRDQKLPISRSLFLQQMKNFVDNDIVDFNYIFILECIDEIIKVKSNLSKNKKKFSKKEINFSLQGLNKYISNVDLNDFSWIYDDIHSSALIRKWCRISYGKVNSSFFKKWIKFTVNLNEVITGILSKQNGLNKDLFLDQMSGRFDSSSEQIINNYNNLDLVMSKRFSWYEDIKKILYDKDFLRMERDLNSFRILELDKLIGVEQFSVDFVIAYYFKLRIIERESKFNYINGKKILNLILHNDLEELYDY